MLLELAVVVLCLNGKFGTTDLHSELCEFNNVLLQWLVLKMTVKNYICGYHEFQGHKEAEANNQLH